FATIFLFVGLAGLALTALSALNTAFGWKLALGTRGATTPLPRYWDSVFGLGAASILIIGLTYFGSTVTGMYQNAKGKPFARMGILLGALVLLVVAGRGLQVVALTSTYGSMLAYYCTDEGTVSDVLSELEDDPSPESLDNCMGRTAQWDRHDLLTHVVGAGANFMDETSDYRSCVLASDVSLEYIETAISLGASPTTCVNSERLIVDKVRRASADEDEQVATIVAVLLKAGWTTEATSEFNNTTAEQEAKKNKLVKTLAVLQAG
ncbi:MAG: hypothetical protein ACPG77_13120, partial [Nannocystaceae bacterium]